MIDDQPDIFLLLQWLEPLVDWKPFGLLLPGITQHEISVIEQVDAKHQKLALFTKWLNTDPTAAWSDVLNALTKREEINLLQTINDQLQCPRGTGNNTPTVPTPEPATPTPSGIPKDILQSHSYKLVQAISVNLCNVTDALYAKDLIPQQTKEEMLVLGVTDNEKASKLVNVIQTQLEVYSDSKQYLIDMCCVLIHQQHRALTDIVSSMLMELGYSMLEVSTFIKSLPDNVQGYADNMRQHYKHQPIVATDWPPRIGKDYFGRLALIEKKILDFNAGVAKSAWHMLRGQIDKIYELTEIKMINIEDLLQPTDEFLNLPQLTIFHIRMVDPTIPTIDDTFQAKKCAELEKCIEKNFKIKEMAIQYLHFKSSKIFSSSSVILNGE
ncbi:PREDICTED: uncharacterized protein LOC109582453 [Amphimedon queenslandica]|uniref:CARD domain-containing protein n=1 Tax=Amphimedon queenslandica TaxID=400682 RepID=A0AAN0J7K3_AMPQE|nr:PREDICTED: uncharacterized protein LOC109582453 [Amphimedon queenslandica]|eukprot:XP_019852727.1 PREDICTED: uncharacterized protein LOC109582453 [Amphimedon queenslandica]